MSNYLRKKALEAKRLYKIAKEKGDSGDFAYKLAARSLERHLDELSKIKMTSETSPAFEMLDFRIVAPNLKNGSAPLDLVSKSLEEIRKTLGYAALRVIHGDIDKKRIPKDLSRKLDLRLHGLLPGSARFVVSAASNRDLLDYGLSKSAIERMFAVLSSMGQGEDFHSSVNVLGPSSAKSLRKFLKIIKSYSATAEFTWKYSGDEILKWNGTKKAIDSVTSVLEATKITKQNKVSLHGKIELLSKREKIELRVDKGNIVKILYPKSKLPQIRKLHLEQEVTLYCQVTETQNLLTDESRLFYELLDVRS